MTPHETSCHRLLAKWAAHKAGELRNGVRRCRTAYKDPTLGSLTNRYADTLEAAAKLFDDLQADLKQKTTP